MNENKHLQWAVEIEDLVKNFGAFTAVDHISLKVRKGEIFGFLGPNGAGKSTTIRMLCGILVPTAGKGKVSGFDIFTEPEKIKENIGYMSQKFSLYDDLTVEENLDFFSGIYRLSRGIKKERKEWALQMAGLQDRRESLTRNLAGGWKQRLALGCAILHEPSILFLDEPTSGVDPLSRRSFWDLIYEMAGRGVTVFVTTHYMDEAEYCDRLALIDRGKIIALGTPVELKTRYMPEAVWELETDHLHEALGVLKEGAGVTGRPAAQMQEPPLTEVAVFGNTLHVVTRREEDLSTYIPALLAARGIATKRLEQIEPSLEDVFVSLIEIGSRDNL
ncbi:MAG: ABC transporter ATP-binding protein [Deltaproteobacteria bacterium]|jgi:ABC-2 type transport system ATP-binding protein|nr:ABC transporter ATP-binding protein [Deltaproteobacteria bacterium]